MASIPLTLDLHQLAGLARMNRFIYFTEKSGLDAHNYNCDIEYNIAEADINQLYIHLERILLEPNNKDANKNIDVNLQIQQLLFFYNHIKDWSFERKYNYEDEQLSKESLTRLKALLELKDKITKSDNLALKIISEKTKEFKIPHPTDSSHFTNALLDFIFNYFKEHTNSKGMYDSRFKAKRSYKSTWIVTSKKLPILRIGILSIVINIEVLQLEFS